MKRFGYIIERVIDPANLNIAFDNVISGKRATEATRRLKRRREQILTRIVDEIRDGTYKPPEYREFAIVEAGKERQIQSLPLTDRIALHAIMRPITELLMPTLIRDTYASLKGRGIHDGLRRLSRALEDRTGTTHCLKMDVRKFYGSIDRGVLITLLRRKVKDERMMRILINIIEAYRGDGLPIGFHSSQFFGNFYLSGLDHFVKEELGCRYYFRYCDDIVILSDRKDRLHDILARVVEYDRQRLNIEIKDNYQIFPIESRGIDFLGYVTTHDEVKLRKRIKQRAARRLHKLKSRRRRREVAAALWGWAKHADAGNLIRKLNMRQFKDIKIDRAEINGKRMMEGESIAQSALIGETIVVEDFEADVKGIEGKLQYVVQLLHNNKRCKMFTGSPEIKHALDECRRQDALPFEAKVVRSISKGKSIFKFE